jgi:hypothetical protein
MKSINQINGRIATDPTILHYIEVSSDAYRYSGGYKNNYYNFIRGGRVDRVDRLSISGNFIYGAARRSWALINGFPDNSFNYARETKYTCINIENIYFNMRFKNDLTGVIMYVETSHKSGNNKYMVKSNDTWTNFDAEKYAQKYINTVLFAPGAWRNIQIYYNLLKSEVAEKYRKIKPLCEQSYKQNIDYMVSRAISKRLRKYNVVCDCFCNTSKLIKLLGTINKKFKHRMTVQEFNPFDMLDRLSMDYDTDDGIINAAESEIMDNNIIWI